MMIDAEDCSIGISVLSLLSSKWLVNVCLGATDDDDDDDDECEEWIDVSISLDVMNRLVNHARAASAAVTVPFDDVNVDGDDARRYLSALLSLLSICVIDRCLFIYLFRYQS
jgi:hypothetical protein